MDKFDIKKYEQLKKLNKNRKYLSLIMIINSFGFVFTIGKMPYNILYIFLMAICLIMMYLLNKKIKNLLLK